MNIVIRRAVISDISNIQNLIKSYAQEELLLLKSRAEIVVMLPNFIVAECDGQFAGSVAFKVCEDEKAEIVSWVVNREYLNHGIGSMLISYIIDKIEDLGIKTVYTLTLRPNVFEKHGFQKIDIGMLSKKIWTDCIHCPRNIAEPGSVKCPEIALIKNL